MTTGAGRGAMPAAGPAGLLNAHLLHSATSTVTAQAGHNASSAAAALAASLHDQLFRFSSSTGSALVAYEDVRADAAQQPATKQGEAAADGLVTASGTATLHTLKLRLGDTLCGYVQHLSAEGLSVLVMGGVSMRVPRTNIPATWRFDGTVKRYSCWVPDQGDADDFTRAIYMGDAVACCVKSGPLPCTGPGVLDIRGSLLEPGTGLHSWSPPEPSGVRQHAVRAGQRDASQGAPPPVQPPRVQQPHLEGASARLYAMLLYMTTQQVEAMLEADFGAAAMGRVSQQQQAALGTVRGEIDRLWQWVQTARRREEAATAPLRAEAAAAEAAQRRAGRAGREIAKRQRRAAA